MLTGARYYLRPMVLEDILQVEELEREAFATTWPPTAFRRELSNRLARYVVAVDRTGDPARRGARRVRRRSLLDVLRGRQAPGDTNESIAGYVGLWLMVDAAHLVAIAVRVEHQRRGMGDMLLAEAIDIAQTSGIETVTLEVRRSNTSAQALYEKYRFLKVGVRPRYYSDNHEDAIVMSTPPISSESYQEHLAYLRAGKTGGWRLEAGGERREA